MVVGVLTGHCLNGFHALSLNILPVASFISRLKEEEIESAQHFWTADAVKKSLTCFCEINLVILDSKENMCKSNLLIEKQTPNTLPSLFKTNII